MERYMILLKSYKRMPLELEQTLRKNVRPLTVRKHDIIQPVGTISDHLCVVEKHLVKTANPMQGIMNTVRPSLPPGHNTPAPIYDNFRQPHERDSIF
jgi:hypothetical protein